MKSKISLLIFFLTICLLTYIIIFQGCKSEPPVQPVNNNNQTPETPNLISPYNETSLKNFFDTLVWKSFTNAVSYEAQVSLDANFNGIMVVDSLGITATRMQIPPSKLTTNLYYYWRIKAFLPNNKTSNWSSVWRFNIILNPPTPPTLILPHNDTTNQSFTPILQWTYVDSAQFYRVQISKYSNFSALTFDSNRITLNQVQVPVFYLNTGTQYFWRANASNSNGASTSQWSSVFNFTTLNGPQPNCISGRITFADTAFVILPDFYVVNAYSTWPPDFSYVRSDTLTITKSGGNYIADYTISRLYNGNYYVAVVVQNAGTFSPFVMGIYGCDTVHTQYSDCPNNPITVQITNNFGITNVNFLSWADSTKRIFGR